MHIPTEVILEMIAASSDAPVGAPDPRAAR